MRVAHPAVPVGDFAVAEGRGTAGCSRSGNGWAAAAERGVPIPQDVALVSFDDPYFGELLEPSLTAVAYDACLVGERAAALLVDAMSSETDAREVRVPVTLVTRRSCGCDG